MSSNWYQLRNAVKARVNALTAFKTELANVPSIERADLTEPTFLVLPADAAITYRNRGDTPKTMAVFIGFFAPLSSDKTKWDDEAEQWLEVLELVQTDLMQTGIEDWRTLEVEWVAPISEDRWRNYSQFSSILRANFQEL